MRTITAHVGGVYVSGTFTTALTISAADDIVITGNLTTSADGAGNPTGTAMLGLVATQFVRVMHGTNGACGDDLTHTLKNPVIDAAILALIIRSSLITTTAGIRATWGG